MLCERSRREIVGVGVDYITATAHTKKGRAALERIGEWELRKENDRGNDVSSFYLRDFKGLRCGSAEVARSDEYSMVRVSSHIANERWADIVPMADNISRLDLQVTLKLQPIVDDLAEKIERSMLKFKKEHNRKIEIELRRNDVKGKTLYTGSRKSDLFSRCYDKGKESKLEELRGSWRLENQFQNSLAKRKAEELHRRSDRADAIYAEVASYYSKRGAVVLNSRLGSPLSCGMHSVFNPNSSARYTWLQTQVRPYIEREISAGHLSEVLNALGLSNLVQPIPIEPTTKERT